MKSKTGTSPTATLRRSDHRTLGPTKAAKFALVEGLTLDPSSVELIGRIKVAGLKGDAFRAAIAGSFRKK